MKPVARSPGSLSREDLVEKALGRKARVLWTDNRSVYLSVRWDGPQAEVIVRLHRCFAEAPEEVWGGLGAYLSTGKKAVLGTARGYFERWIRARPAAAVVRPAISPARAGRHHDLREILDRVSAEELFGGLPPVDASWGSRRAVGRRTVRLGSYLAGGRGGGRALVRVHSVLDSAKVPGFVVEHVVRHEMLHHLLHVTRGAAEGRRHRGAFRRLERGHVRWAEAETWLRDELPGLLRNATKRKETS